MSDHRGAPNEEIPDGTEPQHDEQARQVWMELFYPGRVSAQTRERRKEQWDAGENTSPTPADQRLSRISRTAGRFIAAAFVIVLVLVLAALLLRP